MSAEPLNGNGTGLSREQLSVLERLGSSVLSLSAALEQSNVLAREHKDQCGAMHARSHDLMGRMTELMAALKERLSATHEEVREQSGRHRKADADEWRDEPSVVVKLGGRWTFARIVGGLAKAWPLFLAGAGYAARWLVERLN
jgi:hypothetical protein